jgi:phosphatidylserine synthase
MKTSIPCPSCQMPLTIEHFEDFPTPFNMKCPHCRAKLKETKMTPLLLLIAAIVVPLLIFLGIKVKSFLSSYFPIVEKVPTIIVFLAFCYPLYALYESFNAIVIINKGNLKLKKRQ